MTEFWVCAHCRSLNRGRSKQCYSCRAPYAPYDAASGTASPAAQPGSWSSASPGPSVAAAAPGGAFIAGASAATAVPAGPAPIPTAPPAAAGADGGLGLLGGVVGGATGAIVSAGLWYAVVTATHFQVGIVAVAVGFIVARAVLLGAGRPSLALVPVSVVSTLLALAVAQYLITIAVINEIVSANADGAPLLSVVQAPGDALFYLVSWFQFDPLTLVFWAIALLQAVVIPWRQATRPTPMRWTRIPPPLGTPTAAMTPAGTAATATSAASTTPEPSAAPAAGGPGSAT